ncbi:MAG TPA: FAD-dependent monooxygenase [Mesorhizobium sp.]|jgi:salicylate hydroxylase|nr:FAD-dependent monooxygenase [Mesorhizobium sp.]
MAAKPVLIAGAGIAGLTAALSFARRGLAVTLLERAERLEEVGAGLQLSPNASRVLFALGLEEALLAVAARPEAVRLIDARSLRELAHVPLGAWGERRWGAPYLALHRADLQRVLLDQARRTAGIELRLGAEIAGVSIGPEGAAADTSGGRVEGSFLAAADGVNSAVRRALLPEAQARETGLTAWRAAVGAEQASSSELGEILPQGSVAAFLHPRVHLVAYPLRQGAAVNLVAVARTSGAAGGDEDHRSFAHAFRNAAPALAEVAADRKPWTAWPLRIAPPRLPWAFDGRAALIGDAAHAMTPFAAQGAAMAVEDAATLASAFIAGGPSALPRWEAERKARIAQVLRRGMLNRLTWHAWGPIRLGRDAMLKLRPPETLAADLDWLYGWRAPGYLARSRIDT